MIEVKNVSFCYGRKKASVFSNFSLSLNHSGVYGLLGKNGTGKSTLLYLMTGLLFPKSGEILYNGTNVAKRKPSVLENMFIVPEEFSLPATSMKNYVKINAPFYPKFSVEQLQETLALFDLDENMKFHQLSMGERKKMLISFALATNTPLLIMDEPTNGLDIPSKSKFRKAVASNMNDERSIIISTHQVSDINNLLDHVIIIDRSQVLLNASTDEICRRLQFTENSANNNDNALYSQPSLQGSYSVQENNDGEESMLNLETLFNATLQEREKIAAIFNK